MAVKYDKLFYLLIDKKMTTAQLAKKAQVSANIITRMKRNEYISLKSLEKLRSALDYTMDGIIEFMKK